MPFSAHQYTRIWLQITRIFLLLIAFSIVFDNIRASPVRNQSTEHGELSQNEVVEACDISNSVNYFIYCSGKLLKAVNYHSIYADSKTFVDKPMKKDAKLVAEAFNDQFKEDTKDIEPSKLRTFLTNYFHPEGQELDTCALDEWQEEPPQLKRIKDKTLRQYALDLNVIWKKLCRRIKPSVKEHADRHSLIYVEQPFIVPGGRFREFYYWDAYWIVKGLIASGLLDTTKHMIQNFVQMVNQYGFVPNGGRVYYLQRSQPPFLIPMVYEYYQASRNTSFVMEVLSSLEKEVKFWDEMREVSVEINGVSHSVYQYRAGSNVPRPESYREDVELTKQLTKEEDKRRIYRDLASAAESGWDFSSRWFSDGTKLRTIQTTNIIPVDLNAFMCWNFKILRHLYSVAGDEEKAQHYGTRYRKFVQTFQSVFYVRNESGWYDYNINKKSHNFEFFLSVASPLFTGCYDDLDLEQSAGIFDKMEKMGVFNFAGGIPTSLNNESGQQWDYPNGWSPLNHMIIEGLRQSKNARMQQKAFWLAEKWVLNNYRVFTSTRYMWEKYNVIQTSPDKGSGGEYDVQEGFGWTNGAVLDLLRIYSDRMKFDDLPENPDKVAQDIIAHPPPPIKMDEDFTGKRGNHILRDSVIHEEGDNKHINSGSDRRNQNTISLLPFINLGIFITSLILIN